MDRVSLQVLGCWLVVHIGKDCRSHTCTCEQAPHHPTDGSGFQLHEQLCLRKPNDAYHPGQKYCMYLEEAFTRNKQNGIKEAALSNNIVYHMMRQRRKNGAMVSVDATNYYDRIHHAFTDLTLRRWCSSQHSHHALGNSVYDFSCAYRLWRLNSDIRRKQIRSIHGSVSG